MTRHDMIERIGNAYMTKLFSYLNLLDFSKFII